MPRPTPSQLAYGTATVVFSTVAMLLLSEARDWIAVALIVAVGLALGTLVATTAAAPRRTAVRERAPERVFTVTGSRVESQGRVKEHSLRR